MGRLRSKEDRPDDAGLARLPVALSRKDNSGSVRSQPKVGCPVKLGYHARHCVLGLERSMETEMSTQKFDGSGYKTGQKDQWDSVAEAWGKWWPIIERGANSVSTALAGAIGAGPGQRILDVSTGIGEPAVTLARLVGPDGSVVATDQSAGMLAVAGERIKSEGLSNIELVEVDTEALDLPENEFDGAVCRWGLMFLPDLQSGLQAIRRSLKPGAKFAAAVWATPDRVPLLSLPMAVSQQGLDPKPPPPPADSSGAFAKLFRNL